MDASATFLFADYARLGMAKNTDSPAEKPEDDNVFARNLKERMNALGFENEDLVAAVNKLNREDVQIDDTYVKNLRSAGLQSLSNYRKPRQIKAIADVLGVKVEDLFIDNPPWKRQSHFTQSFQQDAEDLIERARTALSGPKAEFLVDAIDMAFAAAVTSTPRRKAN